MGVAYFEGRGLQQGGAFQSGSLRRRGVANGGRVYANEALKGRGPMQEGGAAVHEVNAPMDLGAWPRRRRRAGGGAPKGLVDEWEWPCK